MRKLTAEDLAADFGLEAAMNGKSRESNPYPLGTSLNTWWDMGWLEYEDEDTLESEILARGERVR